MDNLLHDCSPQLCPQSFPQRNCLLPVQLSLSPHRHLHLSHSPPHLHLKRLPQRVHLYSLLNRRPELDDLSELHSSNRLRQHSLHGHLQLRPLLQRKPRNRHLHHLNKRSLLQLRLLSFQRTMPHLLLSQRQLGYLFLGLSGSLLRLRLFPQWNQLRQLCLC